MNALSILWPSVYSFVILQSSSLALQGIEAFSPVKLLQVFPPSQRHSTLAESYSAKSSNAPLRSSPDHHTNSVDDLSDERKANLFQFLLRDLEVEGVPLLGCDATETHVFQAALWTTLGELSENDNENKVCLVFESMPVDVLKTFAEDFAAVKNASHIAGSLPELQRISCNLISGGVGPAMIIETQNRTDAEKVAYASMKKDSPNPDEIRWTAAMKTFVARMVAPLSSDSSIQDSIAYRLIGSTDPCDILSGYWTSICELQSAPEDQISSIVLSYPPSMVGSEEDQHNRYYAIAELMNRMLFLFESEDDIENVHLQPFYDRDATNSDDEVQPIHGHLPPTRWMQSNVQDADTVTIEELRLQNYQRRSPLPSVILERVTKSDKDDKYWNMRAIGNLVSEGEEKLKEALKKEIQLVQ